MKNKPSCLFRFLTISLFTIAVSSGLIYFLTKEKPYTQTHPPTQGNTVSILLLDGLSKRIFKDLLAQGKLPHLAQLIQKSTYVEHGIAAFPSMTGYGFYPFITGEDASKSGIMGLRWFDRRLDKGNLRNYVGRSNVNMNLDIHPFPKNIFEIYDSFYTASINSYMNRGVHHIEMTNWAHTTSKFQEQPGFKQLRQLPWLGKKFTKNHFEHESLVMDMAIAQLFLNPKVQWVTFPSLDASNHISGTTDEYFLLLQHIDGLVGRFIEAVNGLGQSDKRMIAIVTDHGISDVSKNLDIPKTLQTQYGISLIRGSSANLFSSELRENLSDFVDKNGYFVINGNLSAYIYLRDTAQNPTAQHWRRRLPFALLEHFPLKNGFIHLPQTIASFEGVELVACLKNDSTVSIFSAQNSADIIYDSQKGYRYLAGIHDPLSYNNSPILRGMMRSGFHSADAWLEASVTSDYPDALHRLYQLMSAERVGDLLITSQKGYDVAAEYEILVKNYKGGHGGLRGELLDVPYILYDPQAQPQVLPFLRAEDVGKMIKSFLKDNEDRAKVEKKK